MPDISLTEQEVQTLLRCLNDRVEPPEALAKKLFPKLYAGFDFKTLNRASNGGRIHFCHLPAWASRRQRELQGDGSDGREPG